MPKIVIYTTKLCPWCERLKAWLKERKIPFEEKNVEEDPIAAQEMIMKSGQQGVPVIEIDGKIIIGFDVEALKKALKLKD